MAEGEIQTEMKPPGPFVRAWRLWNNSVRLQMAVIVVVGLMGMAWFQLGPGMVSDGKGGTRLGYENVGLTDVDSYYHIKMGYMYRTGQMQQAGANFHWTRESIWNGAFSNKDFLFHIYLSPFTLLAKDGHDADGLVAAGKLAATVQTVLLMLVLFGVLRGFGVKHAWFFVLFSFLLGGSYYVFRVNMCRSYLWSIALSLAGWLMIANRRRVPLFLITVIYTLAYTASHFLLLLVGVRAMATLAIGPPEGSTRWRELRADLLTGLVIIVGLAVGLLVHPEPGATLHHWWVQNVVVLALSHQDSAGVAFDAFSRTVMGVNTNYANGVDIALGAELNEIKGRQLLFDNFAMFFTLILTPVLAACMRWRPSREAVLTGATALAIYCLYLMNSRFIEYAAPFMAIAAGIWVTGIAKGRGYEAWTRRNQNLSQEGVGWLVVVLVVGSLGFWIGAGASIRARDRGDIEPAARWLASHKEAHGKVVFHDFWHDFPHLFFYADECDYLIGLDPTFMVVKDRRKYELWRNIIKGKREDFVEKIRDDFKASYLLVNRGSSDYLYARCKEEAKAGRLELKIADDADKWSLFEVVKP
ncbi:MAG: hypothetical protein IT462_17910 [Planctomycetes bacterium]|nr:hypothetical protein [Planctomycetota bacterium]